MNFEILDDSKNYTAQIITLPHRERVDGLDNLVLVNVQGNKCLVSKDYQPGLYVFFPCESVLPPDLLGMSNLYRHPELNLDKTKKGFFEDSGRVKAVKFKGVISSGLVMPLDCLAYTKCDIKTFKAGDEFNRINGVDVCKKYIIKRRYDGKSNNQERKSRLIESIIDIKMAPEHFDTSHLMKNLHKLNPLSNISVTVKLHGTSMSCGRTLVNRKLSWRDKIAKFFGVKVVDQNYEYYARSRHVIKSVGFSKISNKDHYYKHDLWTEVSRDLFEGKLNDGEIVYGEIIGVDLTGKPLHKGYSYGFDKPKVYLYRISNINRQGIEIDLPYNQMVKRAEQLGVPVCNELFVGRFHEFLDKYGAVGDTFEEMVYDVFYNKLLDKPSIFDPKVIEEGFCIRIDKYPTPTIYKVKSPLFLLHETKVLDTGDSNDDDA